MGISIKDENWISSRTLATVLNLSSERVRQLEEEGLFTCKMNKNKKQFDLIPSVQVYVEYLRKLKDDRPANQADDEARCLKAEAI